MSKKKNFKNKALNEFRFNNTTGHPDYVFEESNNKFRSLGLTHNKLTFGRKNMPLSENPKKGVSDKAYIRNGINSERKRNYSKKPIKNMRFAPSDMLNVKAKIRNYKKQRKRRKRQKNNK